MTYIPNNLSPQLQAAYELSNKKRWDAFGERQAIGTTSTMVDVWQGTADTIPLPSAAGEQMYLVSTSANDTAAGTGARQVHIHYLNASGVDSFETVTLNGVTPVATNATDIRFVDSLHTWTVGSSGVAEGTITIYKSGAPTTVYNQVNAGGNMSLTCHTMVPAGKNFFMTSWDISATDNKPILARLRATSHFGVLLSGIFLFQDTVSLQNSTMYNPFEVPRKFPSLAVIKVSTLSTATGGTATASFSGWLEDA